jgi:hypothetical protein
MRTYLIIFLSPLLFQYLSLLKCGKDLPVEQLISQLAVERFYVTILPGTAWFNKQCLYNYVTVISPDVSLERPKKPIGCGIVQAQSTRKLARIVFPGGRWVHRIQAIDLFRKVIFS